MNFDERKTAVKSALVEPMSRQWAPPERMASDPLAQQEALAGMVGDVVENMPTDLNAEEARLLLGRVWKELRQTSRYRVWPANADVLAVLRDEVGRFRRDKPIAEAPKLPPRNNPHPDFCRKRAASFRAAGCEKIAATWDALADQSARNLAWWAAAREKGVK